MVFVLFLPQHCACQNSCTWKETPSWWPCFATGEWLDRVHPITATFGYDYSKYIVCFNSLTLLLYSYLVVLQIFARMRPLPFGIQKDFCLHLLSWYHAYRRLAPGDITSSRAWAFRHKELQPCVVWLVYMRYAPYCCSEAQLGNAILLNAAKCMFNSLPFFSLHFCMFDDAFSNPELIDRFEGGYESLLL